MKIRLSEIPEDGRSFSFTRETGELNKSLKDLIPSAPYKIEMTIRPLGNAYEMDGRLVTSLSEICSLCGWDLNIPLNKPFKEILLEEPEIDRETHHVHGSGSVDFTHDVGSSASYKDGLFEAGDFVHELVAISEPLYPSCGDPDCEHLEEANLKRAELAAEFAKADETRSPFAALKDVQLKKQ